MRPGQLKHRITFQSYTESQNAVTGEMEKGWVNFKDVWAKVQPLRGTERFEAQQVQAELSHKVTVRFMEVETSWRLLYEGRAFEIESIIDVNEANKVIEILCKEKVG